MCVCVSGGMEGVIGIENIVNWTSPRQGGVYLSGGGGGKGGYNVQSL